MPRAKGTSGAITISDVAKAAGVATMTVSRYLNRHPNVTDKTARKVRAAIDKLGYSPNHAARILMGRPSNVIGLVLPNLDDAFFAAVAHGAQEAAGAKGAFVWIAASGSNARNEATLLAQMAQHRVDGILLIPCPESSLANDEGLGRPMVTIDRPVKGRKIDAVVVENRGSSREAVNHLISHGYKRIACLGSEPELFTIAERIGGYSDAMREHFLEPLLCVVCDDVATTRAVLEKWLARPKQVEAIFTLNNLATIRVLEALDSMDVPVPEQVALIGFDDFELAAIFKPRLTVIRQPVVELGRGAARLLFERIEGTATSRGVMLALQAELILRESCGCKRGG
jgi:LacI family transcriptional regulator